MNKYFWFSAFLLFSITLSFGQTDEYALNDTLAQKVDLFGTDEALHFTLKSDFKKFKREKFKDKYQKAQFIYKLNDSTSINKEVRIKARGEFRKKTCSFPPIRLNWRKTETVKDEFSQYYKLKMVTHCSGSKYYEQYVFKEFMCYKLYNILSDKSFKVRLIDVKYIDTGKKRKNEFDTWAFFIEDFSMMAERLGSYKLKNEKLSQRNVEESNILEVAMFMFMIGNGDWSVPGLHNIKLLKPKDYTIKQAWAVPYDFDYSGMVNASYAIPNEERLGIKSVTERVYLGPCKPESKFKPILDKFKQHKDAFYDEINNFDYLSEQSKKEMTNYLDEFYRTIDSIHFYENYLKAFCKETD
jgi:hypothetical protein